MVGPEAPAVGPEAPAYGESRRQRPILTPVATAPLLDSTRTDERDTRSGETAQFAGVLSIL
jgi:hypothetical protein